MQQKDLVNLLNGITPTIEDCIKLEKEGLMEFVGNQHNERWAWRTNVLNKFTVEALVDLYNTYRT